MTTVLNKAVSQTHPRNSDRIPVLMLVYAAASLLHFAHNATYLHEYPNMPPSLTSLGVYAAWCAVVAVGLLGYWVYRRVHRITGLALIAVYAVLGFGGLDHYVVAPVGAHSWAMHLTIAIEVGCAAMLLIAVTLRARNDQPGAE
jgi:hypothetical protein